jgi:hypothetical protein
MTLNITVAARWLMGMSSDFRLSVNGKPVSDCAPKQVVMHNMSWSGLLCYNGVAHYGSHDTAAWLEEVLQHKWGAQQSQQQVVDVLVHEGSAWLSSIPLEHRRHTFTLITYEDGNPLVHVISNYERLGETNLPAPADRLFHRHKRPRGPKCIVTGQAQAVSGERRKHLEDVLAQQPPAPDDLRLAIAEANRGAAPFAEKDTVSEACVVAYLWRDGSGQMNVYGDVRGEFMPPLFLSGMPLAEQLRAAMAQVGAVGPQSIGGIGWPANQRPDFTQPVAALNAMSISFGPSKLP